MIDAPAFSCMCKFMCIIQIALETQVNMKVNYHLFDEEGQVWTLLLLHLLTYSTSASHILPLSFSLSLSLSAYSVGEIQSCVSLWARLDPTCCCHSLYMYPSRSVYQSDMSVCGLGKVMIFINLFLFFLCMITWAGGTMVLWHFIACLYIYLIINVIFIVLSC